MLRVKLLYGHKLTDVMLHRRAVIGYGIDEEDQIDQWTEDAESVSMAHSLVCMCVGGCVCSLCTVLLYI